MADAIEARFATGRNGEASFVRERRGRRLTFQVDRAACSALTNAAGAPEDAVTDPFASILSKARITAFATTELSNATQRFLRETFEMWPGAEFT
jgi:hypothetical protein